MDTPIQFPNELPKGIQIQYHDVEERNFSTHFMKSILSEIQKEAPEGSEIKADISFHRDFYKGAIHIESNEGPFFGFVAADSIEEIGQKLLLQMKSRLTHWRESHPPTSRSS